MTARARIRARLGSACGRSTAVRGARAPSSRERSTVVRGVRIPSSRGQSTVEVVGLLPLLLAAGLAVFSLLHAGRAEEAAGNAAEAGAVALLQGREPREAASAALAGWPERRAAIAVSGRRVTVRVTPPGPFGARLRASATADAGRRVTVRVTPPGPFGARLRASVTADAGRRP
jgi:Flp pilus assembly protein TadG